MNKYNDDDDYDYDYYYDDYYHYFHVILVRASGLVRKSYRSYSLQTIVTIFIIELFLNIVTSQLLKYRRASVLNGSASGHCQLTTSSVIVYRPQAVITDLRVACSELQWSRHLVTVVSLFIALYLLCWVVTYRT